MNPGDCAGITNPCEMTFKGHILYMSKRAIRRGEELTLDYRFDKDIEQVPCCCGAKQCRGVINLVK